MKPKIAKPHGSPNWRCADDQWAAYGSSPAEAYLRWVAKKLYGMSPYSTTLPEFDPSSPISFYKAVYPMYTLQDGAIFETSFTNTLARKHA